MYWPTRSASLLVVARTRLWTEKPALVLEEDPQPLGDGEDDLAMGNIQKERLPHPLAPFLKPFGMARRAESPGAAGEHEEPLLATIRTSYAGKSAL